MTTPPSISHDRCSELLLPLVGGELAAVDAAAVQAHLARCRLCREELDAVRSLRGGPVRDMDDLERARLRAGVAAGLRQIPDPASLQHRTGDGSAFPSTLPAGRRRSRPGAWLGVAATALVLVIGSLAYLGSDDIMSGGSTEQGGASGASEARGGGGAAGRVRDQGATDEGAPAVRPKSGPLVVRGRPKFSGEDLTALGRTAPVFGDLADTQGGDDSVSDRRRFAGELREGLGGAFARSCLDRALATGAGRVPVYGALGRLEGRRVLVLGFLIPGSPGGEDRFVVTWWKAGGGGETAQCPRPLGQARGQV